MGITLQFTAVDKAVRGKDAFPLRTQCWVWLNVSSDLTLYVCRYIPDVYRLLGLVPDGKDRQKADGLCFSFARALPLA